MSYSNTAIQTPPVSGRQASDVYSPGELTNPQIWTSKEKYLFRVAFVFFGLCSVPLDAGFYTFLYNIDYAHLNYRELTEIVAFFNPQFINIFSESGFFGIASYVNLPFILLLAIVVATVWTQLDRNSTKEYRNLYYWLRVVARYRVAYAAIAWGYKKLFVMQMPAGNVGLYHTEFIDFFAKRLYWEAIGVSAHYEVFLGFAEFIGGFLLLFRRTTGIGAAITFVVFGNIAIANHAYDIGENVPSACLAMLSLFIFWYDLPGVWQLIVQQKDARIVHHYPVLNRWQNYARLSVKYFFNFVFVILFFIFEVYGYTHNDFYKIPNTPGLANATGYYNVTEFRLNDTIIPYSPFHPKRWQDAAFEEWSSLSFKVADRPQQIEMFAAGSYPRLGETYDNKWHFDWRGDVRRFGDNKKRKHDPAKRDLGITWELSGLAGRQYYYYKADTAQQVLSLQNKNKTLRDQKQVLHYRRDSPTRIILWGTNEFKDSIYVVLDKSQEKYPLLEGRREATAYIP